MVWLNRKILNSKPTAKYFGLVFLLALASCGDHADTNISAPFRANILVLDRVDPNERPHYALADKEFNHLVNFDELDGPYLKLRRGGELTIREVDGSIVSPDSFSGGSSPKLRYKVEDGVAVPRDYETLAQLTAYYQFDLIFSQLEEKTGLPLTEFMEAKDKKIEAFFEPKITFKSDSITAAQTVKLNAAYVPIDHQFLLFQRSTLESIPLAFNLQVLSHEFGHAIFDFAFFGNKKSGDRFDEEYVLSGLNEGFADFISYSFTGSSDILRSSIEIDEIADERHFLKIDFTFDSLSNEEDSPCGPSFYCLGTLFVKSLVNARIAQGVPQATYAKELIRALKTTLAKLKTPEVQKLLPVEEGEHSSLKDSPSKSYNGKLLGAFFNALLNQIDALYRPNLCSELEKNFGTSGFPSEARSGVCAQ